MSYLTPLRSDLKLSIILSLLEGKKKLAELGEETKTRETTILHVLKELDQLDLIKKVEGTYQLTSLGVLEAQICKGCYQSFNVLEKYKEFWLTHDLSAIPPTLLMKIGDLYESELVKSTRVELQKVHETGLDMLRASKTIIGVSPIVHHDHTIAVAEVLNQGGKVILIVTPEVLEMTNQTDKNPEETSKLIRDGSLQIYLNNCLKFSLTITEKTWALGLFNLDGEYDYTADLRGSGEEGLEWGQQLFRDALKKSTKI
ncbi:MAG: DUF1724 domain-containing protein [Nitrososphaerota archaeon]|uniref:helix-turn-helix transcriptional regulator n=1 Tax=Candidatus Bathycorpusculum sp. TaxID=2994959 RepID=UPI0028199BC1|nr:DUF1724 domain-containing protein [Candidatus Termitimicrobium sp.]MCL2432103.1 DUF1724 domain-containing protein [Candidatus Termitimicrobium sp.]MDR0492653.1 DUF1724 domain-containing protein [Nitrososphaerota archaeon]